MEGCLVLSETEMGWMPPRDHFDLALALAVGAHADPAAVPTLLEKAARLAPGLFHAAWPDRYPAPGVPDVGYLSTHGLPPGELEPFAEGLRRAAASLRAGDVPAGIAYDAGHAAWIAEEIDVAAALVGAEAKAVRSLPNPASPLS